jgi:hypothetical protein
MRCATADSLPHSALIALEAKIEDMIRISALGGAALGIYQADLNRAGPSMMGLKYRYAADSNTFIYYKMQITL